MLPSMVGGSTAVGVDASTAALHPVLLVHLARLANSPLLSSSSSSSSSSYSQEGPLTGNPGHDGPLLRVNV